MTFSQRMGLKPIKSILQIDSMDADLRNSLWSVFDQLVLNNQKHHNRYEDISESFQGFLARLWLSYFKLPIDAVPQHFFEANRLLRQWFLEEWLWNEVYDFIEFFCGDQLLSSSDNERFVSVCNTFMERELSGYRIVDNHVTPITDDNELAAIKQALQDSSESKLSNVRSHLESALEMLSDRKSPDYRNSIKESISAVEAVAQKVAGKPKASLADALSILKSKIGLHPALKKGFESLYGYTSDAHGIRHALQDEPSSDFADAKYMLVSCSGFVSYLIEKAAKVGITF